jgi:hypothetical protein
VPWSAVRLLRLRRAGELGGLLDGWDGWTIWRDRLVSPDGRAFLERDMRRLWLTLTQAAIFRDDYAKANPVAVSPALGADRRREWNDRHFPVHGAGPGAEPSQETTTAHGRELVPLPCATALDSSAAGDACPAVLALRVRLQPATLPDAGGAAHGRHDANMTPECSHIPAASGVKMKACNLDQTAPVSRFSPPARPGGLPLMANRGGTNLNKGQCDVNLTPPGQPLRKGVVL